MNCFFKSQCPQAETFTIAYAAIATKSEILLFKLVNRQGRQTKASARNGKYSGEKLLQKCGHYKYRKKIVATFFQPYFSLSGAGVYNVLLR